MRCSFRLPSMNIVVYPNSGESYHTEQKKWQGNNNSLNFGKEAIAWFQSGARLIGGCCRTGPAHIKTLREILLKNKDIHL